MGLSGRGGSASPLKPGLDSHPYTHTNRSSDITLSGGVERVTGRKKEPPRQSPRCPGSSAPSPLGPGTTLVSPGTAPGGHSSGFGGGSPGGSWVGWCARPELPHLQLCIPHKALHAVCTHNLARVHALHTHYTPRAHPAVACPHRQAPTRHTLPVADARQRAQVTPPRGARRPQAHIRKHRRPWACA